MIQLAGFMWAMAFVFGVIGYMRGLSKELISLAGIVLGLFTLFQFDGVLRETLLANVPPAQKFIVQCVIFIGIVFFAYQTNALGRRQFGNNAEGRDALQSTVLGAVVGFINGYPLSPYIIAPPPNSPSFDAINSLPLFVLAGGPGGTGNLLALAVIILFLFVLILI
jgi:hypothetical protein